MGVKVGMLRKSLEARVGKKNVGRERKGGGKKEGEWYEEGCEVGRG